VRRPSAIRLQLAQSPLGKLIHLRHRSSRSFGLWALTLAGIADDQAHERRLRRSRKPKDSGTSSVASTEAMYGTSIKTEDGVMAAPVTDALHGRSHIYQKTVG
jgi:hypothetical protein